MRDAIVKDLQTNSYQFVAKKYNLQYKNTVAIANRAGIYKSLKYTSEQEADIVLLYKQGLDTIQIASKYNTFNTSIRRILIRNSVELISTGDRIRKIKTDPFADLTDPNVMYWLGMIAADGCLSSRSNKYYKPSIRLNCGQHDKEHLQQYATWLGNDVNVVTQTHKKYRTLEHCVGFTLQNSIDNLTSIGITPQKSMSLEILIPLTWDFIRGVFDGDGCFGAGAFQIASGSEVFIKQLAHFFEKEGYKYNIQAHSGVFVVSVRQHRV